MADIATVRAQARALARENRGRERDLAAEALRLTRKDEQLAFEVFRASPRCVLELSRPEIEGMLEVLHDWNSTDCFGCFVSGVAWREGVMRDGDIARWTKGEPRWTRRAALVSTVPLNLNARGATNPAGEAGKTLAICSRLIDDRDDMVVKAMSWALRTLASKDADAVREFLNEHRERLAPRVLRETTNKLSTGLKNPLKNANRRPGSP
jgi:hypothetical protein